MGHRLRLVALAAAVLTLVGVRTARAIPLEELVDKAKPAVVELSIRKASGEKIGSGSGFIVSKDGRVATNYHVVAGADQIEAVFEGGKKKPILGVWAYDESADLAILQLPRGEYRSLPLARNRARPGEEVVVIGSPMGFSGSVSTGIVSALRDGSGATETERPKNWSLQITAPISPGSSGSPILTRDGEVIGVAVGVAGGQALNFAVPVSSLEEMLKQATHAELVPVSRIGQGRTVKENLLISAGVFAAIGLLFVLGRLRGRRRKPKARSRGRELLRGILKQ